MATPLVSIVVCTYNGERYLAEQLSSLCRQTYPNLEILVCDDASIDGTAAIVQALAAVDSRIKFVRNSENVGLVRNFESGMRRARGDYIAPCDQDDIWLPEKTACLIAALEGSAASLAFCDSDFIDAAGRPLPGRLSERMTMSDSSDPVAFLLLNIVSGHALLARRELVERAWPFPADVFHDWWLAFVAACAGGLIYVDRPLVHYRQHGAATTDITGANARGARRVRARGWRLEEQRRIDRRIVHFADHAGPDWPLVRQFARLWAARENAFICPALVVFLIRHRDRVFAFLSGPASRRVRRATKFFWGMKTKRLISGFRYAKPRDE